MNLSVVGGAGYVGLVTGVGFAALGHSVVCQDVDEVRINALRTGHHSIYEPDMDRLLRENLARGRLHFTTSLREAIRHGEIVVIAVGTPARANGEADLSQVVHVAEEVACEARDGYQVIVVKSTVPVGTMELLRTILSQRKVEGKQVDVVANPEFLREGKAFRDFFSPDRIVIGSSSPRALTLVRDLYAPIVRRAVPPDAGGRPDASQVPVIETDLASAQMTKYAANAFLAMRISFINEIAVLCERSGADVRQVVRGLGYDPRIGAAYLSPGLGFGGPCLEKDLHALIKVAEGHQFDPTVLRATLERNAQQTVEVVGKIKRMAGGILNHRLIAVYGLAFKAFTNDLRNSMALRVIHALQTEGANIRVHDPMALPSARAQCPDLMCCDDPYDAAVAADVLVVATEWPEFRELDYARIKAGMRNPCIVDGRNLLDPTELRRLGFRYAGVGIPTE